MFPFLILSDGWLGTCFTKVLKKIYEHLKKSIHIGIQIFYFNTWIKKIYILLFRETNIIYFIFQILKIKKSITKCLSILFYCLILIYPISIIVVYRWWLLGKMIKRKKTMIKKTVW